MYGTWLARLKSTPEACVPDVLPVTNLRNFPLFHDKPMTIKTSIFLKCSRDRPTGHCEPEA